MRPVRAALGALLACSMALSGCGGGAGGKDNGVAGLSAKDIVAKSQAAARSAKSVHVKGTVGGGQQPVAIDMSLQQGTGARGTVSVGPNQVQILRVGDAAYLRGDKAFWTAVASPAVAAKLADKYVKGSTQDPTFKSFLEFTDLASMFDSIFNTSSASLEKVIGKKVGGTETVGVKDPDPQNGGVLYVATTGQPYPLLIESVTGSSEPGSVSFTDWNQPVSLQNPPADQVIDISSLG